MKAPAHKGPSVDPEHGDIRAEPGTRAWALGVRASLWDKERDLGKGVADVAMRLDRLLTTDSWKHLFRADGTPFDNIEEYITYRHPYGLGVPLDMMRHYLGLTHEGRAIRAHLGVKGHPTHRVPVASLRRDGGTQVRAGVCAATVDNYREAMADGAAFPPVVAFFDGVDHWLADGFHRVTAAEAAGLADVLTEVREGTRRDALRYALGANRKHGLPMSGPDKRRAIGLLLADDEWRGMSDRAIAAEIGASDKTVASVRREMVEATAENPQLDTPRTGRDGKVRRQRTASAPVVEPVQVEPAVEPAAPAPQEQPEAPAVEPDAAVQPAHETANDAAPVEPEAAEVSTQNGSESAEVESLRAEMALLRIENEEMSAELEHLRALNESVRSWVAQVIAPPAPTSALNLERVAKLVALTNSPNENEARNAAMLACRMIREHQLRILTKEAAGAQGSELEQAMRAWAEQLRKDGERRDELHRQRMAEYEAETKAMLERLERLNRQAAASPRARRAR